MPFEHYIYSGSKKLRCGYTTGTCAALAAKAAAEMLLTGNVLAAASLITPRGLPVEAEILDAQIGEGFASCAAQKDGGDDCDATHGTLIYARVSKTDGGVLIDGGDGIGRVTRPGLEQPVGAAAINRVPREMIEEQVRGVCEKYSYDGGVSVVISAPEGEIIAKKTFNPNLGIVGGISILGTSGIVEPMSTQALLDSIRLEMKMLAVSGVKKIIVTPGNYGEDFLAKYGALKNVPKIKCSNFIGDTLDYAAEFGFETVLMAGHIGKFVKLAGGVMNTHSRFADCRAEIFTAHAALAGADRATAAKLMASMTTDDCIDILDSAGVRSKVILSILESVQRHLERRASGDFRVGALIFSNRYGLLGITDEGKSILEDLGGLKNEG